MSPAAKTPCDRRNTEETVSARAKRNRDLRLAGKHSATLSRSAIEVRDEARDEAHVSVCIRKLAIRNLGCACTEGTHAKTYRANTLSEVAGSQPTMRPTRSKDCRT